MTLLAQLNTVNPEHLRDSTILLAVGLSLLTGLGSFVAALVNAVNVRKTQRREVVMTETCVSKETFDVSQLEASRRINHIEESLTNAWDTMRKEDNETRELLHKTFKEIERSLGRIEGEISKRK